MRSRTTALALTLTTAIALTGCGANEPSSKAGAAAPDSSPSATEAPSPSAGGTPSDQPIPTKPAGPVLAVKIAGDKVSPNGKAIDLAAGKPLTITFTTDRAGELHVHSKPEQFVKFPAGTSTMKLTIKVPGVVEVEEHDTSHVVAQIEVR